VAEPVDPRAEPPFLAAEREMLESWLEFHRGTLAMKCAGLDDEQLKRRSVEPSSLSLLGLVRHMAEVERNWFRRVIEAEDAPGIFYDDANPDGDFDDVDSADVASDMATWNAEVERAREIAAAHSLDDTGIRHGAPVSLRWIFVHMIEEYARHNGHADLIRERVDGATGE
jgi:uncharacterized damage-inducible protein DinB